MAQLDLTTYTTQVFWLILFFTLLYTILYYIVLPRLAYLLKLRVYIFKIFLDEQSVQQNQTTLLDMYLVQFCRTYYNITQQLFTATGSLFEINKRSCLNAYIPNILVGHVLLKLIKN